MSTRSPFPFPLKFAIGDSGNSVLDYRVLLPQIKKTSPLFKLVLPIKRNLLSSSIFFFSRHGRTLPSFDDALEVLPFSSLHRSSLCQPRTEIGCSDLARALSSPSLTRLCVQIPQPCGGPLPVDKHFGRRCGYPMVVMIGWKKGIEKIFWFFHFL